MYFKILFSSDIMPCRLLVGRLLEELATSIFKVVQEEREVAFWTTLKTRQQILRNIFTYIPNCMVLILTGKPWFSVG